MSKTEVDLQQQIEIPEPGVWTFDPTHTIVGFSARHLMLTRVRGRFGEFSGAVNVGPAPEKSSVEFEMKAASIDTGVAQRDEHLRSPDFLDVERYPTLRFRSTSVERTGERDLRIHGELTIRDATRPVALDATYEGLVKDPWGGTRAAFSATAELSRDDWDMTWNVALEAGGWLVSKTAKIEIEAELVKA